MDRTWGELARAAGDRALAHAIRLPGVRRLWIEFPFGSVETRVRHGIWKRPHYAYGVFAAAALASRLKLPGLSVMEFGVAGGKGLLELESIGKLVSDHFGIAISVFGFDTGEGMPEPVDYRDLPHVWARGYYKMDAERLQARLGSTRLVLGDIAETLGEVFSTLTYPVGFVAFDLDYYSSTKASFRMFEFDHITRLPRVFCYFDDVIFPERACYNQYVGELCAIREYNEEQDHKKLSPIHLLRHTRLNPAAWNDQMYVFHDFRHPLYCTNVTPSGEAFTQMPLSF